MKNRQKNFFSATKSNELPELERFKKMTFLSLEPNQDTNKSQKKMETTSTHSKENYLQSNCAYYMNRFQEVCTTITREKFAKVNKDIDNLLKTLRNQNSYEKFFHALILNTDQNEDLFFEQLEDYFKNKLGYRIEKLFDYSFNEIKNLFKNLHNDNKEENKESEENEDLYSAQKTLPKLILLRNIQKIDSFNLNLYIDKMIEYTNSKYVVIFDVGYDPRCLFEKLNTKNLTRMILHKLDYVSSKNIYKEILYKFIHEENNLFVPDSKNLNQIVEFVNHNQISVKAFMKYFQFLIIYFFILNKWENDDYLIFLEKLKNCDFVSKDFFKKILTEMKSSKNDKINEKIEDLDNLFLNFRNIKLMFFRNYSFLESILLQINKNFNKYDFFFDFLQLGNRGIASEREKNRLNALINNLSNTQKNWREIIETIIIPTFDKMYKDPSTQLFFTKEEQINFHSNFLNKLNSILNKQSIQDQDFFHSKNKMRMQKLLENGGNNLQTEEEKKELNSIMKSDNDYLNELKSWFELYLKQEVYLFPANYALFCKKKTQTSLAGYLNFREMTNPSLSYNVMNQLQNMHPSLFSVYTVNKKEKNETNSRYSFLKTFQNFLSVFCTIGLEFKIKCFFYEFLKYSTKDEEELEDNKLVHNYANIFLKFCHEFYLMGYIAKKNQKSDVFIKNYFKISSFYNKNDQISSDMISSEINSVKI